MHVDGLTQVSRWTHPVFSSDSSILAVAGDLAYLTSSRTSV